MSFLLEDAYKPLRKKTRVKNKHGKPSALKYLKVFIFIGKYGIVSS
ncbi:hypothetical protein [Pseudobacteroides cellulosolvens]|nr:hypothetical protein [Pseudobacteroides cellulosolvens]